MHVFFGGIFMAVGGGSLSYDRGPASLTVNVQLNLSLWVGWSSMLSSTPIGCRPQIVFRVSLRYAVNAAGSTDSVGGRYITGAQVVGFWLVVGGWWLVVVAGWWLVVGGRWLVVGGWWLVAGGWWLVVGGWWLMAGGWWLVVGGGWLVVGGWWLVVGGWWLVVSVGGCWLVVCG